MKTMKVTVFLLLLVSLLSILAEAGNMRIHLKTSNGKYLQAVNGGGGDVNAKGNEPRQWETFLLIDVNGGKDLISGEEVQLRTYDNRHFLCAEYGGGDIIIANRTQAREWETFTIYKLSGGGVIRFGDVVSFKAYNGNYMTSEGGGGGDVNANRPWARSWESFEMLQNPTFLANIDDLNYVEEMCNDSSLVGQYYRDLDLVRADGTWDDQGLNDCYNVTRPFARVMTAAHLLFKPIDYFYEQNRDLLEKYHISRSEFREQRYDYLPEYDFFYQAYDFVRRNTRRVKFSYSYDALATTHYGVLFFTYDRIDLKIPFFWQDVLDRAGTLVHEARHLCNIKRHDCNNCLNGKSCDSSWYYNGANTFEATYHMRFWKKAGFATQAMRDKALMKAEWINKNKFCDGGLPYSLFHYLLR